MWNKAGHISVIGCGYWGRNLVRNFAGLDALKSVVDSNPGNLAEMKSKHPGLHFLSDIEDALTDPDIRGVVIATPAVTHFNIALQALNAGKDVFVEKPLALTVDEGTQLVELAAKKSRILMAGHLLRYHPAILKLQELLKAGELGKLQYIYSNRLNLGKFRTEENVLWSFAPHDIDVMLYLTGAMPETVSCHGGNYLNHGLADVTVTNLSFPTGVRGHVFVSWLHPFKEQRLVVIGDAGMAVFDDLSPDNKLVLFKQHVNWDGGIPAPNKNPGQAVAIESIEPLRNECQHFLDCIASRQSPRTDGRSALNTLAVLTAAQESLQNGGAIVRP